MSWEFSVVSCKFSDFREGPDGGWLAFVVSHRASKKRLMDGARNICGAHEISSTVGRLRRWRTEVKVVVMLAARGLATTSKDESGDGRVEWRAGGSS